jgi:hypothetical protein
MRRIAYLLTGLIAAVGLALGMSLPASAATTITGTTYLPANLDSGNGSATVNSLQGAWAIDTFHRALSVTATPDACNDPINGLTCYTATISDTGTFETIPGNGHAPNPASTTDAGTNIAYPPVSGPLNGGATYIFETSATPAAANIPGVVNNDGHSPGPVADSTSDWFVNAFSGSATFYNSDGQIVTVGGANDTVLQNTWGWSYTSMTGAGKHTNAVSCESWTDSAANDAGALAADGNITGTQCAGTLKAHYVRVPNCLGKRVYVCTGLLGGKGLRYAVEHSRRPRTAYFVKGTSPDPRAVVLKGSVVKINDVHKL